MERFGSSGVTWKFVGGVDSSLALSWGGGLFRVRERDVTFDEVDINFPVGLSYISYGAVLTLLESDSSGELEVRDISTTLNLWGGNHTGTYIIEPGGVDFTTANATVANINLGSQWSVLGATRITGSLSGNGSIHTSGGLGGFVTVDYDTGDSIDPFDHSVSGSGGLKFERGKHQLTQSSSFNGGLFLNGGEVTITSGSRTGALDNTIHFGGGQLNVPQTASLATQNWRVDGDSVINAQALSSTVTISGGFEGDAQLKKIGSGDLILTGDNSAFAGEFLIEEGNLLAGAGDSLGDATLVTLDGTSLTLQGSENFGALAGNGSFNLVGFSSSIVGDRDTEFVGSVTGSGNLTHNGAGSLRLSGALSGYTGDITVTQGGVTLESFVIDDYDQTLDIAPGATATLDNNGSPRTLEADLINSGTLAKTGTGDVTVAAAGGAGGDVMVHAGRLILDSAGALGAGGTATINAPGVLTFNHNEAFSGLSGDGGAHLNDATLTLGMDSSSHEFVGQLTGAGAVVKEGSGAQRFSGDNTGFTGAMTLIEGELIFARGESLSRDLHVPSGAKVGFDPASGESDYAHSLSGPGAFEKTGAGTLNMTGDSPNYAGYFFVGEGAINIDGTLAANEVAVVAGGTLGGNGSIDSLLFAEPGSVISPGRSVGQLTTASFKMAETAKINIEIAGHGDPGVDYDQLIVTGATELQGGTLEVSFIGGFQPTVAGTFTVLDLAGPISGVGFNAFAFPLLTNGYVWDTSQLLTTGVIAVEASLPGDFNADGVVNAIDYTVWRDNLGGPAGSLANDVDGGIIGGDHFDTWVANFGTSLPAASVNQVVPEPGAAIVLTLLASPLLPGLRRFWLSRVA